MSRSDIMRQLLPPIILILVMCGIQTCSQVCRAENPQNTFQNTNQQNTFVKRLPQVTFTVDVTPKTPINPITPEVKTETVKPQYISYDGGNTWYIYNPTQSNVGGSQSPFVESRPVNRGNPGIYPTMINTGVPTVEPISSQYPAQTQMGHTITYVPNVVRVGGINTGYQFSGCTTSG